MGSFNVVSGFFFINENFIEIKQERTVCLHINTPLERFNKKKKRNEQKWKRVRL